MYGKISRKISTILLSSISVFAVFPSVSYSHPLEQLFMPKTNAIVAPPAAFLSFCLDFSQECFGKTNINQSKINQDVTSIFIDKLTSKLPPLEIAKSNNKKNKLVSDYNISTVSTKTIYNNSPLGDNKAINSDFKSVFEKDINNNLKDDTQIASSNYYNDDSAPKSDLMIPWDDFTKNSIIALNKKVNDDIEPSTDTDTFGKKDYWVVPDMVNVKKGDCEDYALEKRHLLMQQGIPSEAMSLALASIDNNEMHAVLIVSTTDGDMVLDNLSTSVKNWKDVKYNWIAKQSKNNPLKWEKLNS